MSFITSLRAVISNVNPAITSLQRIWVNVVLVMLSSVSFVAESTPRREVAMADIPIEVKSAEPSPVENAMKILLQTAIKPIKCAKNRVANQKLGGKKEIMADYDKIII